MNVHVHDILDYLDPGNPHLPFTPRHDAGINFGRPLVRNTMTRAVDFFKFVFHCSID